jgi:hypothetical protein
MKPGSSKNRDLDRIADAILAADRLHADEIEAVASAPHLFAAVMAGIESRRDLEEGENILTATPAFGIRLAPAMAAVVIIVAAGVLFFSSFGGPDETVFLAAPPHEVQEQAPPEESLPSERPAPPSVETETPSRPRRSATQQAAVGRGGVKRPAGRRVAAGDQALEFYALASVPDPSEAVRDGRIIRVDLPRASLLSLGVNVPLENENATVKTDLLVGPDGVPKAIRLVK